MVPPSEHFLFPPNAEGSEDDERRNPLEESNTSSTDTSCQSATNDYKSTFHFCDADIPASLSMTVHGLPLQSTFSRSHEFSQSTTSSLPLFNIPQVNENDHNPTVNIDPVIPGPAPQLPATEEPVTGSGQGDNLITTMVPFDIIQQYP